ncbi:MAG: hypothetical protein U0R26_11325 [Solirubrobacterales bacterium]
MVNDPEFHPRRWRRRYRESYLIWPPAIAAAWLSEDEVRTSLTDLHGIAVGETFVDGAAPQALMDVRGKEILPVVGGPAVLGQLSVSAVDVASAMDGESIPEDIKTFLSDVVDLAP